MFEEETKNQVEETENVEETTEEIEEGIEFTDTPEEVEENGETIETEEKEEVTENTDNEPKKIYTEDEFNEKFDKKFQRREAKIRKEYEKKYSKLESILNAGLGTSNIDEATSRLSDFYKEQGINIPDSYEPKLSDEDIEVLANKEAEDIISGGYKDIVEEVDKLANIGVDKMSQRERFVFNKLAETRKLMEEEKELASIGIFKEQIEDKDFQDFTKKLNPSMSLKEKYEMYQSTKPKKEIKQIGSMKSGPTSEIKDFYTDEEIEKLTLEDLDKPGVWEAVRKSMTS